LFILRANL